MSKPFFLWLSFFVGIQAIIYTLSAVRRDYEELWIRLVFAAIAAGLASLAVIAFTRAL